MSPAGWNRTMLRRPIVLNRVDDENVDSGAETAESDCSKMSSSSHEANNFEDLITTAHVKVWDLIDAEVMARRERRLQQLQLMDVHLLANPGDSLLLQHTLDRLLHRLCPSLRIFHVSERASPFGEPGRPLPVAGYPSVAVTFFLHEAYGEERIMRVLDYFQRPPWQYHHTESCAGAGRAAGIHVGSSGGALRPYLLPSRDFYSLGAGMPVWGVRPVHCGGEVLRLTLYSGHHNYEDAVRLYETVLQRHAEEQKAGFCWFTLHTEPGLCLQLALKQLSPGVRVEPCSSAVLQFRVEEIGQLVPLLPNPCTPISSTRWQTEDLDGNKVLFQVKTPFKPQRPLTCAFPLACPSVSPQLRYPSHAHSPSPTTPQSSTAQRQGSRPRADPSLEKLHGGGERESLGSDSCCSTPPGSSCYSSQRSSPALAPASHDSPLRPSITRSLSHLLLEEDEEDEPETDVDTGVLVSPRHAVTRSSSMDLLLGPRPERPALLQGLAGTWGPGGLRGTASRTVTEVQSPSRRPLVETDRTTADSGTKLPSARAHKEPVDEFFI